MKALIKQTLKTIPGLEPVAKGLRGFLRSEYSKLAHGDRPKFHCPICDYRGPFEDFKDPQYPILYTVCPKCDLYERHRLQLLVMNELAKRYDFSKMSILHFAPEPRFRQEFQHRFMTYHTADIAAPKVDFKVDIRKLPFPDESYDVLYASHVLEHVANDQLAFAEIKRVLKPNGFALLPVPVVSPYTIEYPEPNPHEFEHVRAIGLDYFDRYKSVFSKVEIWKSEDFDPSYQLYTYEDRTIYPIPKSPHRVPMTGEKHPDYVPVCYR